VIVQRSTSGPARQMELSFQVCEDVMTFDLTEVEPKQSNWLELNVRYEGQGRAEFTSPEGQVLGTFVAEFNENGESRIETRYDSLVSKDPDYEGNDLAFVTGAKTERKDGARSWSIGSIQSQCRELSISSPAGLFTASSVYLAGYHFGESAVLRFRVREGKLETGNLNSEKYFVIPLFNFVAELSNRLFGDHQLRIYPTPRVAETVPAEFKTVANIKANEKNSVIAFTIGENLYFIERLPDYDERLASLKTGAQRKVTAALVGDVGSRPVSTLTEFRSWFPYEMLSALGFASGTEVGRLWVEIRDDNGALIRRLHGRPTLPTFWEGDELIHRYDSVGDKPAMGEFVTAYLTQAPEKRSYLEVVMNHARLGSLGSQLRLYDTLDHLIRALECLCREHGLVQQSLAAALSSTMKAQVQEIVDETKGKLQRLAEKALASGALDEHRILRTITSKAVNMHTTENKFGLSVVALLEEFGLCDAEVIDKFLTANPRPDGIPDWASVITAYRGATIHEGYMDFQRKHDAADVVRVCILLKDALARVIFKECGYTGTYTSVLRRSYGPQSLDWIQPNTPPTSIGF
jgi:hypothetical protein